VDRAGSTPLGRGARFGLVAGGVALVAAALGLGYVLLIEVVVGLFEPVHLTPLEAAFVAAELALPVLLLALGLAALVCTDRARLRRLGFVALAAAADLGLAVALYGPAMTDWCAGYRPVEGQSGGECAGRSGS
jgi:hypothetical protein